MSCLNPTPPDLFRVWNVEQWLQPFSDAAVNVDALDFLPLLAEAEALLATGQRFLAWQGDSLTGGALWARTAKLLDSFRSMVEQAGLCKPAMLAQDTEGDRVIAAMALRGLVVALQTPQLVQRGMPYTFGDTLRIPVELVEGPDIDAWFRQLAGTVELLRLATTGQVIEEHDEVNFVKRVGEVWHLCYRGEKGQYPEKGNRCIGWLDQILRHPRRSLTVAELVGDPESKLAGIAKFGGERVTDDAGIQSIRSRLDEIEDIIAETGGSEYLETEKTDLLYRLQTAAHKDQIRTPLQNQHHNIATQLRTFLRKLQTDMPGLAAHLKPSLKLAFPHFGYYPPDGTPAWKT
jgi:hypothetical protein